MFANLSIRTKLIISFLAVIVLTVILGIFAIFKISGLSTITENLAMVQMPAIKSVKQIDSLVGSYRRSELLMTISSDPKDVEKYIKRASSAAEKLKKEIVVYEKLISSDEERKTLSDFKAALDGWMAETPKIVESALKQDDAEAAKLIMGTSSKQFNAAINTLEKSVEATLKKSQALAKQSVEINSGSRIGIVVLLLACIVIGLVLAVIVANLISKPMILLANEARQIAAGDLSITIKVESQDEVGHLAESFRLMVNSLKGLIRTMLDSSAQVIDSSGIMQQSANTMAHATDEAVSRAMAVATASEEMSATSGDIAQNCQMAAEGAKRANDAARNGGVVIEKSIAVMGRIAERVQTSAKTVATLGTRSDQIGSIVGTIEDIADQTNLLALNAAIEAARAGEQGRGFAVVADEVRALAERTTKATREIGEMIKAIQQETKSAVAAMQEGVAEVEMGTSETARSGEALVSIREEISNVTLQVQQIATAAEEQTATTSEISGNIHQVSSVVGETMKEARQCVDLSQNITGLATTLKSVVNRFKL
jgi:methyl-accepting chemotaxis protein